MSLLIQLRYRIKAIETIKKITHAMRLISMSTRSRLKVKEEPLHTYITASQELLSRLQRHAPAWQNSVVNPPASLAPRPLIILIGSQRGLCGNFNTVLFSFLEKVIEENPHLHMLNIPMITVGKKAIAYAHHNACTIIHEYPELTARHIPSIAHDITRFLFEQSQPFTHVNVLSNQLKTFFVQKPHDTQLIPFINTETENGQKQEPSNDPYLWEQSPDTILDQLAQEAIESELHYLLFESLLAEHAARFISMDNATRNAQSLLEETQLQYNKLRQAKITKELTELVSSI